MIAARFRLGMTISHRIAYHRGKNLSALTDEKAADFSIHVM